MFYFPVSLLVRFCIFSRNVEYLIFVISNVSLLQLQVYNEVVCNCHEDSKLLDVIALVESVYQADTQRERVKYGRRLQKAIKILSELE